VKVEIHNDTDKLIYFHATTAGNINGVPFDENKVTFDGYIPSRSSTYLLSKRLPEITPNPHPEENTPSFRAIYEYDLRYRNAEEKAFSRHSAKGLELLYWPKARKMTMGKEIVKSITVNFYNQVEE
jgi:hypothetical protein